MMGLEDFDKVMELNVDDETPKNSEVKEDGIENTVEFEELNYYIENLDELFIKVRKCKTEYVKSKISYKKKEAKLYRDTDWGEISIARVDEGFPKITNKEGREGYVF